MNRGREIEQRKERSESNEVTRVFADVLWKMARQQSTNGDEDKEPLQNAAPQTPTLKGSHLVGFAQDSNMADMFKTMTCQQCGLIPSPSLRFLCPDGHLLCYTCGSHQYINHSSKCMTELHGEEVTNATANNGDEQGEHAPLCQNKILRYPADPIFTAIWMNAMWKCPVGCQTVVKGSDLYTHALKCEGQSQGQEHDGCSSSVKRM